MLTHHEDGSGVTQKMRLTVPEVGALIQVSIKWHIASSLQNVIKLFFFIVLMLLHCII